MSTPEEFSWDIPETFNFSSDVVDRWASEPDRLALITVDAEGNTERYTYADIARRAAQLANLLTEDGIKQGDRVIVMLPRVAEWQIAMVALARMGAVPIPCITMLTADDLTYRIDHAGAVGAVCLAADVPKFVSADTLSVRVALCSSTSAGLPNDGLPDEWVSMHAADQKPSDFAPARVAADDPAVLYYTSGSTGSPKGVTHAARSLSAWSNSAIHWLDLTEIDRIWCTADTGWSKAGTSILYGPWSQGSAVLFYDGPFDPQKRFELLDMFDITVFCAAATELRRLVLEDTSSFDLSHLRSTVSAGESVNPEIIDRWRDISGTTVLDGYGQTETLMTVTNRPGREVKLGSMGRPLPGVEVAVHVLADSGDGDNRAAAQGSGELLIRLPNPQLMLGYWNDADRTASSQLDLDGSTWFMTGDNVDIDDDGYVFYTGRADDIIGSAGYRIGPQEVENALVRHAAVQECAVVGVPDAERGEVVKAWVVVNDGHEAGEALVAELQRHTKETTAPYKYPRQIQFVDELPKTVTGKIRRNVLRERG